MYNVGSNCWPGLFHWLRGISPNGPKREIGKGKAFSRFELEGKMDIIIIIIARLADDIRDWEEPRWRLGGGFGERVINK